MTSGGDMMETTKALILEVHEPLSKALNAIMESGTAVIIVKNGVYTGIIDDRHTRQNIADSSKIKCESVIVSAPTLSQSSTIMEKLNHFLAGHFKALAVVDEKGGPLGLLTRTDFLDELIKAKLMPKIQTETVMGSPLVSIDHSETVGAAKRIMKERNINRIVVLHNGYPYALLSKHDLLGFALAPKKRAGRAMTSDVIGMVDERKISDLALRNRLATVNKEESLNNVARMMIEKKVSALIVLSDKKPVGVITASDIFKNILNLFSERHEINISGLPEEDAQHYPAIIEKINDVVEKFSKTFNIRNISVHLKKRKTLYIAKIFLELDYARIAVSYEEYDIKSVINGLVRELETILEKKKGIFKYKKGRKRSAVMKGDA